MHTSHLDMDDFIQLANIGIIKTYNRYDCNFKGEGYEGENEKIGFIPFLKVTVEGEIRKFIRDTLKVRRKDYNIHEIALSSVDQTVPGKNSGEKEITLGELIEDTNSLEDFNSLELKMEIESYTSCLEERDKRIIYDAFFHNMTQSNIGLKYGVTQVQVSRIIKRALMKMKKAALQPKNIKVNKIKSKENKTAIKNNIHSNKKEKVMRKHIIDTRHALKYFEEHLEEEKPLDEIMDRYCNDLEISKSELNYALHTTCSTSFNEVVDKYMEFEMDFGEILPKHPQKKVPKQIPAAPDPNLVPLNYKKTKKEVKANNPLEGLNILDLRIELDSFEASISKSAVVLRNLPEDAGLSIEDLKSLRNDIDRIIEIKESLSANILK